MNTTTIVRIIHQAKINICLLSFNSLRICTDQPKHHWLAKWLHEYIAFPLQQTNDYIESIGNFCDYMSTFIFHGENTWQQFTKHLIVTLVCTIIAFTIAQQLKMKKRKKVNQPPQQTSTISKQSVAEQVETGVAQKQRSLIYSNPFDERDSNVIKLFGENQMKTTEMQNEIRKGLMSELTRKPAKTVLKQLSIKPKLPNIENESNVRSKEDVDLIEKELSDNLGALMKELNEFQSKNTNLGQSVPIGGDSGQMPPIHNGEPHVAQRTSTYKPSSMDAQMMKLCDMSITDAQEHASMTDDQQSSFQQASGTSESMDMKDQTRLNNQPNGSLQLILVPVTSIPSVKLSPFPEDFPKTNIPIGGTFIPKKSSSDSIIDQKRLQLWEQETPTSPKPSFMPIKGNTTELTNNAYLSASGDGTSQQLSEQSDSIYSNVSVMSAIENILLQKKRKVQLNDGDQARYMKKLGQFLNNTEKKLRQYCDVPNGELNQMANHYYNSNKQSYDETDTTLTQSTESHDTTLYDEISMPKIIQTNLPKKVVLSRSRLPVPVSKAVQIQPKEFVQNQNKRKVTVKSKTFVKVKKVNDRRTTQSQKVRRHDCLNNS